MLIAQNKQAFFDEKLSENIGKPKELWSTLKSLGMLKKTVFSNFNAIDNNKSLKYNIKTMSNVFKDFFSNLAESFLAKLPDPSNKYNLEYIFLNHSNFAIPEVFHIKSTSEEKVFKIMKNIEISKAAGIDRLPGWFLIDGTEILSKPISDICNLSIFHGIFPNACKVAKLQPIFKKGKNVDPFNYRPMSLLPLTSKVIEKVVHNQTNEFLSDNKILCNYQSGFTANHLANLCLSFLTDKVLKGFDEGLLTGMILNDLQKAFDTILLKELASKGLSDKCIQWFRSYLCERIFFMEMENQLSNYRKVSCSILQGSILGPFLFLIYVSGMPQAVKSNLFLHANDSCLMYQHRDVEEIEKQLNKGFENVCNWFGDNKLSIHFGKDKTIYSFCK